MSGSVKKKDKKKKKGCRSFISSLILVVIMLGVSIFAGYRYIRPLYFDKTSYFDHMEFGFRLPEGFTSKRMPVLPRGTGMNISLVSASGAPEEIMDRISLSAAGTGWKPEKPSLPKGEFSAITDRFENAVGRLGRLTGDIAFFTRNGEYLVMKTIAAKDDAYVAILKGKIEK